MNISIILAHPGAGSLNHAIAQTAVAESHRNGHAVTFHDLYREGFDPLLSAAELSSRAALQPAVAMHCKEIAQADGVVIVHPNWWGQPPAMMKGWIDRVIRPDVAYRFVEGDNGEGVPVGLLKARAAIVFNTSNTPPEREQAVFGDPLDGLWKQCIFGLCGVKTVHREMFGVVIASSEEQRAEWLARVREVVRQCFPAESR